MASEAGAPVDLYIYDLTNGFASLLSPAILGRQIEGVWHTSVVVYEQEFFYGGGGITSCAPGGSRLGAPAQVQRLGSTQLPRALLAEYLQALAGGPFAARAYRLLDHNCNHFSDELAHFLCGAAVPKRILLQPERDLPPAHRAALQALLDAALPPAQPPPAAARPGRPARQDSPEYLTLNTQIEEARLQSQALEQRRSSLADKLARKQRRQDRRRRKHQHLADMSEAVETVIAPTELARAGPSALGAEAALGAEPALGADVTREAEPDARYQEEMRRRARDPPIVFKDIDAVAEFEKLALALEKVELSAEDRQSLDELQQYLVQGEGSWVLGDDFLAFVGRLLAAREAGVRAGALRCLSAAALREDVSLLLHQDRRHHALLGFAHAVDAHSLEEQRALALFMCNLFENISSSEWLLYISEWDHNGQPLSNIRATTKVCVHSTLAEDEALRDYGTALMYNIATKEVFDEVCVELAMALLQLLQAAPAEELLYRSTRALARLAQHSQDVPQLVALVGPDPAAFRGTSQRVDEQIDLIMQKVK